MALDMKKYAGALGEAVRKVQESMGNKFLFQKISDPDNGVVFENVDQYFREVHDSFASKQYTDSKEQKKAKSVVYAASRLYEVAYGLCACDKIEQALTTIMSDEKREEFAGLSDEERVQFREELMVEVEKEVLGVKNCEMEINQKLVDDIKEIKRRYPNDERFMDSCFVCADWINSSIMDGEMTTYDVRIGKNSEKVFQTYTDSTTLSDMRERVIEYADAISDSLDHPIFVAAANVEYNKNADDTKSINPRQFLKHFQEDPQDLSKLSAEEFVWAKDRVEELLKVTNAAYPEIGKSDAQVNVKVSDLYADGIKIAPNANSLDANAKVMGALLSGKNVTANPMGSDGPSFHINPHICDKTVNSLLQSIWEKLEEFIKGILGKTTEREKLNQLANNLEAKNEERKDSNKPLSFDELNAGKTVDKLTAKIVDKKKPSWEYGGMHR